LLRTDGEPSFIDPDEVHFEFAMILLRHDGSQNYCIRTNCRSQGIQLTGKVLEHPYKRMIEVQNAKQSKHQIVGKRMALNDSSFGR
jgi:hypothetical protein